MDEYKLKNSFVKENIQEDTSQIVDLLSIHSAKQAEIATKNKFKPKNSSFNEKMSNRYELRTIRKKSLAILFHRTFFNQVKQRGEVPLCKHLPRHFEMYLNIPLQQRQEKILHVMTESTTFQHNYPVSCRLDVVLIFQYFSKNFRSSCERYGEMFVPIRKWVHLQT